MDLALKTVPARVNSGENGKMNERSEMSEQERKQKTAKLANLKERLKTIHGLALVRRGTLCAQTKTSLRLSLPHAGKAVCLLSALNQKTTPARGLNLRQDGGSNPGPIAYEAIALPAELSWRCKSVSTHIFYKKTKKPVLFSGRT